VQTLFYGVFSAFVLWHRENLPIRDSDRFDWKNAAFSLNVPIISALFHEVANPLRLKPLGLDKLLDWTAGVLNRVDRSRFFSQFDTGDAVQYFYEPFLEAFDPGLRRDLGVWYTPREVVRYQVERIDRVLRTELGLLRGLADPSVYILDPCCGTGAYLVEVLRRIEATLIDEGDQALIASDLRQASAERVIGFEILPAPFVVAHLQIGMLLQKAGSLVMGQDKRTAIYLTNALTGWQPPTEEIKAKLRQLELQFPEFRRERDAADSVKRSRRVLVVLGNPPYNAFAGTSPEEEEGLVEPYKGIYYDANGQRRYRLNQPVSKGGWGIKKFNLDDLYIRFFRLAERCIAEIGGTGIVSYISNFSFVSEQSFVIMRERLLSRFDKIWIDSLNGDSRQTGKQTPEGGPDPSVFSTAINSEGIKKGTAVSLLLRRRHDAARFADVQYRDFWGVEKRMLLEQSLQNISVEEEQYRKANPTPENRYNFRPTDIGADYLSWPRIVDMCSFTVNGLMEKRGNVLIAHEQEILSHRMIAYFDKSIHWEEWKRGGYGLETDRARFNAQAARTKVLKAESFNPQRIIRYAVRPLDTQWCYYSGVRPLWNEPRPQLFGQLWPGNQFLICRQKGAANPEGIPLSFCCALGDDHYIRDDAYYVPFRLKIGPPQEIAVAQRDLFGGLEVSDATSKGDQAVANLSPAMKDYLVGLGFTKIDDENVAALPWLHALAVGFSSDYLTSHADGIRSDWPRIPLPSTRQALEESAYLGREIAFLLDTEARVEGVTAGAIREELKGVGQLAKRKANGEFGDQISPANDLRLSGWGSVQVNGTIMPGSGRIEEVEDPGMWGGLINVYLNEFVCWRNVPIEAWEFTIGGFQVIKKWLSYRDHGTEDKPLLGRPITKEEARYVQEMARRLSAIILLQEQLDLNYQAVITGARGL
jgi:hypothetical protein